MATVDELRKQIASLEDVIKGKGEELNKEKAARQAVCSVCKARRRSVRRNRRCPPLPKLSGRNQRRNAPTTVPKRKTHPECEVETVVVEPDSPDFNPEAATFIGECDVVRYVMEPMRFKKIIYKVRKYVQDEKIYKGSAPATRRCSTRSTLLPL